MASLLSECLVFPPADFTPTSSPIFFYPQSTPSRPDGVRVEANVVDANLRTGISGASLARWDATLGTVVNSYVTEESQAQPRKERTSEQCRADTPR